MRIEISQLDSPLGRIVFALRNEALYALKFAEDSQPLCTRLAHLYPDAVWDEGPMTQRVVHQLRAYFAGDLHALDALPVEVDGTPFQRKVWAALRAIPVGQTTSYQTIASSLGNPAAVRAVGMANGRNPVALVVPCHRVIASDGTLCGYAGGLWRKEWLLRHEQAGALNSESAQPRTVERPGHVMRRWGEAIHPGHRIPGSADPFAR